LQEFFRAHGTDFGARRRSLGEWLGIARALADRVFDGLLKEYPLAGSAVREQQRERLQRDLEVWLDYDWNDGRKRGYVDVERPFGFGEPWEHDAGGRPLFLRGIIDRIDVEDGRTLLRDVKTGRPQPRSGKRANPDPVVDLQLAIYGLVAEHLAATWKLPATVGVAYAYTTERTDRERSFREDFPVLRDAARGWLEIAAHLLADKLFPRTPDDDDCAFCPFVPVCGADARARAVRLLAGADGVLARFRDLKIPPAKERS
jgi:RecB family exonuclease